MLSIIQFLPILVFFIFLNHSIHAYAGNSPTPHSAFDNYAYQHSPVDYSTPSGLKLRKQGFSRVNRWVTGVVIVLTILNIVVYMLQEIHEEVLHEKYKPSQQSCHRFLLADILSATQRFDDSLVVGQGGFGKVYRGIIDDGAIAVAIKRLNPWSQHGAPEFWSEIQMLSTLRHTNIVSLIGYCDDCDEMILVYDYMVRGTLAHNIHINRTQSALSWSQRLKICIGAAHGLDHLHTGTGELNRIIHRDVKSSNILLTENWTAKVSDFGLSKIGPTNQLHTHVSTNVKGTFGYVDPECYLTHQLTRKSDVYAFGVVLFEVLCGRRAVDLSLDVEQRSLAGWAQDCIKEGKLDEIVDPSLRGQILSDSLTVFAQIADQCLHMFSTKRPTMAEVVVALELALKKQERTDFSFDEEFSMNTGGDSGNQENVESSVREEVVINESHGTLCSAEPSVRTEVVKNESHGTRRRKRTFTKTVWKFFSGTSRVFSGRENQQTEFGQLRRFDLRELQLATDNFSDNNVVGRGSFGNVYKDLLANNTKIAVKRLRDEWTAGGELQFQTEIEIKSVSVHRNIIRLIGFCITKTERILVYPFMQNSSVALHLQGDNGGIQPGEYILPWSRRKQVALGTAGALEYLHEHSNPKIIHRDVNAGTILLDENFEAYLSDFGLAKLVDVEGTHATSAVRGTIGHIPPEYLSTGKLSIKADVFSYGMFLLELITGQSVFDLAHLANDEDAMLLDYVKKLLSELRRMEIADPNLQREYNIELEVQMIMQLALLCIQNSPEDRPVMSEVVLVLKGQRLPEMWSTWRQAEVSTRLRRESLEGLSDINLSRGR